MGKNIKICTKIKASKISGKWTSSGKTYFPDFELGILHKRTNPCYTWQICDELDANLYRSVHIWAYIIIGRDNESPSSKGPSRNSCKKSSCNIDLGSMDDDQDNRAQWSTMCTRGRSVFDQRPSLKIDRPCPHTPQNSKTVKAFIECDVNRIYHSITPNVSFELNPNFRFFFFLRICMLFFLFSTMWFHRCLDFNVLSETE